MTPSTPLGDRHAEDKPKLAIRIDSLQSGPK